MSPLVLGAAGGTGASGSVKTEAGTLIGRSMYSVVVQLIVRQIRAVSPILESSVVVFIILESLLYVRVFRF